MIQNKSTYFVDGPSLIHLQNHQRKEDFHPQQTESRDQPLMKDAEKRHI